MYRTLHLKNNLCCNAISLWLCCAAPLVLTETDGHLWLPDVEGARGLQTDPIGYLFHKSHKAMPKPELNKKISVREPTLDEVNKAKTRALYTTEIASKVRGVWLNNSQPLYSRCTIAIII
jgi:hypothetical protein